MYCSQAGLVSNFVQPSHEAEPSAEPLGFVHNVSGFLEPSVILISAFSFFLSCSLFRRSQKGFFYIQD